MEDLLDRLTGTVVPTWVMVLVISILTGSLLLGVPLARKAGHRRGRRLAHPELFASRKERLKDTALFLGAMLPSVLVWLAVMGVSFIGLTGFAKDVMDWNHWTNMLVPLSLDGISISFGAWAFVAVKRGRHPGRAYKIVLAAATMSAVLNFVHGRDTWSIWAGLYLAFLSMAGMAMFHELLEQFIAGYDDEVGLKTRYPRFGQRWLYAPVSTFAARRAWIVHPPEEGVRPSVRNALDHLQAVRDAKRQNRLDGALRVREEQRAKLVEVQARAAVRRARANGGRVAEGDEFFTPHVPMQQIPVSGMPQPGYPTSGMPYTNGYPMPQQPMPPQQYPMQQPMDMPMPAHPGYLQYDPRYADSEPISGVPVSPAPAPSRSDRSRGHADTGALPVISSDTLMARAAARTGGPGATVPDTTNTGSNGRKTRSTRAERAEQAERESVLDPAQRAELEQIFQPANVREPKAGRSRDALSVDADHS